MFNFISAMMAEGIFPILPEGIFNVVLTIAIALILGLLSTRLMKVIGLPNVTGYLVVGLIIGPYMLGIIDKPSLESMSIISSLALGFIAFSIGVEFKIRHIKEIGKSAITITMFQALLATLFVDVALLIAIQSMPAEAIVLGAIATATAPAATLMVVRQYKAKGTVTGTLLPVVALDDAVGLIVFAVSNSIALSMLSGASLTVMNLVVFPLLEIVVSLVIGAAIGGLLSIVPTFFKSRDNRLIATIIAVFACIGICGLFSHLNSTGVIPFKLSDLLVCMMAGAVFVNLRVESETMMQGTDRWTPVLFMLFFILSGAELNILSLGNLQIVLLLVIYLIARCAGKYIGSFVGAVVTKADKNVRKYLGITLWPQAGVAIGMATLCNKEFAAAGFEEVGQTIVTITMCAVLVYELFGPVFTKIALAKAGEISPEMLKRKKSKKVVEPVLSQPENNDQQSK